MQGRKRQRKPIAGLCGGDHPVMCESDLPRVGRLGLELTALEKEQPTPPLYPWGNNFEKEMPSKETETIETE